MEKFFKNLEPCRREGTSPSPGLGCQKGFTTIEIIVALTLLAVLSVVSLQMITNLIRTNLHSSGQIEVINEVNLSLEFMANELRLVDEYSWPIHCGNPAVTCVTGTNYTQVTFSKDVEVPPDPDRRDTNYDDIVYRLNGTDLERESNTTTTVLAEDVTSFNIREIPPPAGAPAGTVSGIFEITLGITRTSTEAGTNYQFTGMTSVAIRNRLPVLNVLFVVNNPGNLNATREAPINTHMTTTLGHTVDLCDEDLPATCTPTNYDVLVYSGQGGADENGVLAAGVSVPLVTLDAQNFNTVDFDLGTSQARNGGGATADIVDNNHFITKIFSTGNTTLDSGGTINRGRIRGWANDVHDLIQYNNPINGKLLYVEANGTLASGGGTAPARRVFYGTRQWINGLESVNRDGMKVFNRALGLGGGIGSDLMRERSLISMRGPSREKGFTMIEIIVALTLLAVLSVVSLQMITNLIRTNLHSSGQVEVVNEVNLSLEFMANELRLVDEYSWPIHCGNPAVTCVTGTNYTQVTFSKDVEVPPDPDRRDTNYDDIVYRLNGTDLERVSNTTTTVLAEDVTSFNIREIPPPAGAPAGTISGIFEITLGITRTSTEAGTNYQFTGMTSVAIRNRLPVLNVAFVVNNPGSLSATREVPINTHLGTTLGHTVTLFNDGDTTWTPTNFDVIVLSGGGDSSDTWMVGFAVPILSLHARDFDNLDIGTGHNRNGGGTNARVIDNNHFITKIFSTGLTTFDTGGTINRGWINGWANDVDELVTYNNVTRAKLLYVESSGTLASGGGTAADRRVFMGTRQWINGSVSVNRDGMKLFNRALAWAAGLDLT